MARRRSRRRQLEETVVYLLALLQMLLKNQFLPLVIQNPILSLPLMLFFYLLTLPMINAPKDCSIQFLAFTLLACHLMWPFASVVLTTAQAYIFYCIGCFYLAWFRCTILVLSHLLLKKKKKKKLTCILNDKNTGTQLWTYVMPQACQTFPLSWIRLVCVTQGSSFSLEWFCLCILCFQEYILRFVCPDEIVKRHKLKFSLSSRLK